MRRIRYLGPLRVLKIYLTHTAFPNSLLLSKYTSYPLITTARCFGGSGSYEVNESESLAAQIPHFLLLSTSPSFFLSCANVPTFQAPARSIIKKIIKVRYTKSPRPNCSIAITLAHLNLQTVILQKNVETEA